MVSSLSLFRDGRDQVSNKSLSTVENTPSAAADNEVEPCTMKCRSFTGVNNADIITETNSQGTKKASLVSPLRATN